MRKFLCVILTCFIVLGNIQDICARDIVKNYVVAYLDKTIVTGVYSLDTKINGNVLEPGKNPNSVEEVVLCMPKAEKDNQKWHITEEKPGVYSILSLTSGKALSVSDPSNISQSRAVMKDYDGSTGQRWNFKKFEDGMYEIVSCVDKNYALQFGNPKGIVLAPVTGSVYQSFKLDLIGDQLDPSEIESSVNYVSVDKKSSEKGTFDISIEGVESNALISGAVIEVYPEGNEKALKSYFAKKEENGDLHLTVHSSEFDYASGVYNVDIKLLLNGIYLSEVGEYQCEVCDVFKSFDKHITSIIEDNGGRSEDWQVFFVDLGRKKKININSKEDLSAQMIKLFVMGAAYDHYDEICKLYGKENLDAAIVNMVACDNDQDFGNILMLLGNNDAAKGAQVVTDWANANGYADVSVSTMYTSDYCSAKDVSQFFVDLYHKKYDCSVDMLDVLKMQQKRCLISSVIPENVVVANKTGGYGMTINDGALVYSPGGNYVLVIMSNGNGLAKQTEAIFQIISNEFYTLLNQG